MGKALMFMVSVWFITIIAGGVMQGSTIAVASTSLTVDLSSSGNVIYVTSTNGFPESGFIQINEERIAYSHTSATAFGGTLVINPVVRGAQGTIATSHSAGAVVRTTEAAMLNSSINYKLAVISDASGLMAFITVPFAILSLLGSFLTLPLAFLGTDLQLLTIKCLMLKTTFI